MVPWPSILTLFLSSPYATILNVQSHMSAYPPGTVSSFPVNRTTTFFCRGSTTRKGYRLHKYRPSIPLSDTRIDFRPARIHSRTYYIRCTMTYVVCSASTMPVKQQENNSCTILPTVLLVHYESTVSPYLSVSIMSKIPDPLPINDFLKGFIVHLGVPSASQAFLIYYMCHKTSHP